MFCSHKSCLFGRCRCSGFTDNPKKVIVVSKIKEKSGELKENRLCALCGHNFDLHVSENPPIRKEMRKCGVV